MPNLLCEMLGAEFPLIAFSHCRDVVVAVSKAGVFGVLGATTPEQLRVGLDWIEDVDGHPYGLDVLIPQNYVGSDEGGLSRQSLWRSSSRRGTESSSTACWSDMAYRACPGGRGRRRGELAGPGVHRLLDVALAHPIGLVASALGPPLPDLVELAHDRGVLVAALAGKKQHALRHKAIGVDIVVARGYEAGGHTDKIATVVVVPEVVDAVAPTPVVAAGGIGSGRQMAAAMARGLKACGEDPSGSTPRRPKRTRSSKRSSSPRPPVTPSGHARVPQAGSDAAYGLDRRVGVRQAPGRSRCRSSRSSRRPPSNGSSGRRPLRAVARRNWSATSSARW